jgi:AraC family transcriptional regulator, positive regulator of tynA and feaB
MDRVADSSAREIDSPRTGRSWTTDDVRESERFDYWHEVCVRAFVDLTTERARGRPFRGAIRQRSLGHVGVSDIDSVDQQVIRRAREIAASPRGIYFVNLQVTGQSTLRQGRDHISMSTGDVALIDASRPFDMGFSAPFRHASFKVEHHLLRPRLADPDAAGLVMRAATPLGGLVSGVLRAASQAGGLEGDAAAAMADHVIGMIAVAFGASAEAADRARGDLREARRARAREWVERHLADASIDPRRIAAALGVSTRYLHSLFESTGESVMRHVQRRRLERCRDDLADPARGRRSIADIAFGWGFSDLSHFGRAFRAAFGMTPRDWRRQGAAGRRGGGDSRE